MTPAQNYACRFSLAFLWIFTGITSAIFAKEIGYQVLAKANITGTIADLCLYAGATLDVAIGAWLVAGRALRACYAIQLLVIAVYTTLLTLIEPAYWLHPFGPLTKNIPIVCLIYVLYSRRSD